MSSPQANAAKDAVSVNARLAQQAFDIGIPGLQSAYAGINAGLKQGLPGYVNDAYRVQRAGLADAGLEGQLAERRAGLAAAEPAVAGGNVGAALAPQTLGAKLADSLWSSRLQQGLGGLNQQNTLLSLALGVGADTGNDALRASQGQLQAIGQLPGYNPTWAAILGGVNLGGSVYGATRQKPPTASLAPGSFTAE